MEAKFDVDQKNKVKYKLFNCNGSREDSDYSRLEKN